MARLSSLIWTVASAALLSTQVQAAQMKVDEVSCGPNDFYSSPNNGYTIVTNIWNPTELGAQCMTVTDKGSRFEVTWLWETNRATVHSFPHIKFNSKLLPIALGDMSALRLSGSWSFVPGNTAATDPVFDADGLIENSVTANVAIDMFADDDVAKAQNETLAKYEILIWLGTIGNPYPLGWNQSTWDYTLDGAEYTLYRGTNQRGITSFTWFPPQNTTTFDTDFYPLIQFLIDNQLIEPTVQLGLVEFGQEAFFSTGNVTFAANGYNVNITRRTGESATVGADNPSGKSGAVDLRPAGVGALAVALAVLCAFL